MENMKNKIIVPVDFSKASKDAYLYAREIAKTNGASIELIHIIKSFIALDNPYLSEPLPNKSRILEEQLNDFAQEISSPDDGQVITNVLVQTALIEGETTDVIIDKSKKADTLYVIMGNRGKHMGAARLFGSVSSVVAQNAACPVILIPPGTRYKPMEQVLFATNYESVDEQAIEQITNLANTYRASLHFVHISERKEVEDFTETMDQIVQQVFHHGDPAFSLSIDNIHAERIIDGLYDYSRANDIDLIVVVNRERSFIKNIMGKSITQKIAADLEYPVLVYHLT